jgi:hypothetical protein
MSRLCLGGAAHKKPRHTARVVGQGEQQTHFLPRYFRSAASWAAKTISSDWADAMSTSDLALRRFSSAAFLTSSCAFLAFAISMSAFLCFSTAAFSLSSLAFLAFSRDSASLRAFSALSFSSIAFFTFSA